MNILFIHQNFPGQFKHLAPALASIPGNKVAAFKMTTGKAAKKDSRWQGVSIWHYPVSKGTTPGVHSWVSDFETKVIRAEACYNKARTLKESGYYPDVIIAHHGWGESLFLKEVWPNARLGLYCEYFYRSQGADVGFDPEFKSETLNNPCRLHLKNVNNILHFPQADAGISPTQWQASTFPDDFRQKITVVHDGIDTQHLGPDPQATYNYKGLKLCRQDEVVTFVNRNLEPVRGYHIFMRALPQLLAERPSAQVVIVGGNDTSYGAKPAKGKTWKDQFIDEIKDQITPEDWQRVHFVGKLPYDHFIRLLQVSTVHVYLTYPFVLSWSLIEAMSLGCAIVASDTAPVHEAIKDGETGRLVNFFDHASLVKNVVNLLEDENARQKLGANARDHAIRHYDLKTVCLPRQLAWVKRLYTSGKRQGSENPVNALHVIGLGLKKLAGVTEARVDYPLMALNNLPDTRCQWAEGSLRIPRGTPPGILVLHRLFLNQPEIVSTLEQLVVRGWVLVSDIDDDPHHWQEYIDSDFFAFRGVHAVTVSTEPLKRMLGQWNPLVEVFPNAVYGSPHVGELCPKQGNRVRIFFGALNRDQDWQPIMAGITDAVRALGDRVEFIVVHDKAFFDALPTGKKIFRDTLPHQDYLALLRTCDINLLPLADTPFNRLKSDLKFIESCNEGVVPVCSPVVYSEVAEHSEIGIFAETADEWRMALLLLCSETAELSRRRAHGVSYVQNRRLHQHQAEARRDFYLSLLKQRAKLETERQARLRQITGSTTHDL